MHDCSIHIFGFGGETMDDVRHAAEERAARPKKAPVGSSFESERQREKNALVRQLDAQDGRNVHKISAAPEIPEGERVLRVAAYCRVSTDDIDQKLSIHLQIQQYMKRIKENPNWKYAGCYVDDGFSGTNTAHRQGFQKLMKDAMDGKIDMIITKAVSRFARNLMDCIGWVEALQNHDPPIRVFFEQENLEKARRFCFRSNGVSAEVAFSPLACSVMTRSKFPTALAAKRKSCPSTRARRAWCDGCTRLLSTAARRRRWQRFSPRWRFPQAEDGVTAR